MRRLPLIALVVLGGFLFASSASAVHPKTVDFIAGYEGFLAEPYNDPVGYATIGYGHLIAYRPVKKSDRKAIWVEGQKTPGRLTRDEAKRLLRQDLAKYEAEVRQRIVGVRTTRPMMTALTSFAFNLGPGLLDRYRSPYLKKTTNVAGKLRKHNYLGAARDMRIYDGVISGGKRIVLAGLTRRRNDEFKLMLQGIRQLGNCGSDCVAKPDPGGSGGISN